VLGAARIAREQVIPAIRRSGAGEVVAVSSASGRASAFVDELAIDRAYASHEALLDDEAVDAVYIALPNSEHLHWIRKAAAAGKHILCEKPLVLDTVELDSAEAAVKEAGVHLAVAFMYRHHPQIAAVHQLLASGAIGDLVAMHARLHFDLERTGGVDIRLRREMGGGSLLDLGCYPVDFFGDLAASDPEQVAAVAHRESPEGVDTRLAAVLRYGALVATFDCSFDSAFLNTATLVGTAGRITLEDVFRADLHEGVGTVVIEREGSREVLEVPGDHYAEQVLAFVRHVRGEDPDTVATHDLLTRRTVRTVERIAAAVADE
jgi:predicted dehydrogenase